MAYLIKSIRFRQTGSSTMFLFLTGICALGILYAGFGRETGTGTMQVISAKAIRGQFFESSKPEAQQERGAILQERRHRMLSSCRKSEATTSENVHVNDMLYDAKSKSLYCPIPKIGSSFWKRIFFVMANERASSPLNIPSTRIHSMMRSISLKKTDDKLLYKTILGATKFMFTRDPYHRIFSAYVDKLFLYSYETRGISNVIMRHLRNPSSTTKFPRSTFIKQKLERNRKENQNNQSRETDHRRPVREDDFDSHFQKIHSSKAVPRALSEKTVKIRLFNITFSEALQYASGNGEFLGTKINPHFSPIHTICNPCLIGYDFIGKMETFKDDTSFILKFLNQSQILKTMGDVDTSSEQGILQDVVKRTYNIITHQMLVGNERDIVLRKLWKTFQFRGLLSDHLPYPLSVNESGTISGPKMTEVVLKAYNTSGERYQRLMQREKYYHQAYRSVPFHVLRAFHDSVQKDCRIFGYDCEPPDIFDGRTEGDEESNIFSEDRFLYS